MTPSRTDGVARRRRSGVRSKCDASAQNVARSRYSTRSRSSSSRLGFVKRHPRRWSCQARWANTCRSVFRACAKSAGEVDAFHAAALKAGGRSDGAPGLRPHDRVRYYVAFVVDPDGNRIEAVTFPRDDAEA